MSSAFKIISIQIHAEAGIECLFEFDEKYTYFKRAFKFFMNGKRNECDEISRT